MSWTNDSDLSKLKGLHIAQPHAVQTSQGR